MADAFGVKFEQVVQAADKSRRVGKSFSQCSSLAFETNRLDGRHSLVCAGEYHLAKGGFAAHHALP
jgi:hypothetical protein